MLVYGGNLRTEGATQDSLPCNLGGCLLFQRPWSSPSRTFPALRLNPLSLPSLSEAAAAASMCPKDSAGILEASHSLTLQGLCWDPIFASDSHGGAMLVTCTRNLFPSRAMPPKPSTYPCLPHVCLPLLCP